MLARVYECVWVYVWQLVCVYVCVCECVDIPVLFINSAFYDDAALQHDTRRTLTNNKITPIQCIYSGFMCVSFSVVVAVCFFPQMKIR